MVLWVDQREQFSQWAGGKSMGRSEATVEHVSRIRAKGLTVDIKTLPVVSLTVNVAL